MPHRIGPSRPATAILLTLGLTLTACSSSPSASGNPDPAASDPGSAQSVAPSEVAEATPEPASLAPFDHGDIPAGLVGRYELTAFDHYEQTRYVDLNADGTFAYHDGPLNYGQPMGGTIVTGQYGVFGDEIVFGAEVAVNGQPCLSDGRYRWTLEGEALTLVVIEDTCTVGRVADWESGWTKMDAS